MVAHTNPCDPMSKFAVVEILRNGDESVSLFWNCVSGSVYRIEFCNPDGGGMTWQTAQDGIVAGITGISEWLDDGACTGGHPGAMPMRLYRVVACGP